MRKPVKLAISEYDRWHLFVIYYAYLILTYCWFDSNVDKQKNKWQLWTTLIWRCSMRLRWCEEWWGRRSTHGEQIRQNRWVERWRECFIIWHCAAVPGFHLSMASYLTSWPKLEALPTTHTLLPKYTLNPDKLVAIGSNFYIYCSLARPIWVTSCAPYEHHCFNSFMSSSLHLS